MAHQKHEVEALGLKLKAARSAADLTQTQVAQQLTESGYETGKAAVSAWETGRNVPDALVLKRLARYYQVTTDSLLGDGEPSSDALRIALAFDKLSEDDRKKFMPMWEAFFKAST